MKKDKLTIVLVNYNFGNILLELLESLLKLRDEIDPDIWVVDNASEDGSIKDAKKFFPDLHYIENKNNLGFGAANNQALGQIDNEYILVLNPDTKIPSGTLSFMLSFLKEHPEVGAATCRALKSDGKMDWAYHRGFPTPWASLLYFMGNDRLYHLTSRDMNKAHEVDAISGSFFLTRKSVLDKVGLFDEDYWMYAEDIDLCYRIKKAGYKVMYVPDVQVTHLKGVSSGIKEHSEGISTAKKESKKRAFNAFYETMKIFYRKNLASRYPFFIDWLVYLAIDLKWLLAKRKMRV
ncbi:glycosyltransferase family 2 protein [Candidatus Parcubacteria bacterium]|nr:MAG: glycosyltransferase family 2 protein [Candidatus Parcubacteria bacterium]